MVALFAAGMATGVALVLELQKRGELKRKNRVLEAALREVTAERDRLIEQR